MGCSLGIALGSNTCGVREGIQPRQEEKLRCNAYQRPQSVQRRAQEPGRTSPYWGEEAGPSVTGQAALGRRRASARCFSSAGATSKQGCLRRTKPNHLTGAAQQGECLTVQWGPEKFMVALTDPSQLPALLLIHFLRQVLGAGPPAFQWFLFLEQGCQVEQIKMQNSQLNLNP